MAAYGHELLKGETDMRLYERIIVKIQGLFGKTG